jgi:hypothetical protein
MKLLFPPSEKNCVSKVRRKLTNAGIRCHVRRVKIAKGIFGVPSYPELLIDDSADLLKALRLIGKNRLRDMTIVFAPA